MRILVLADASSPHTERWLRGLETIGHEVSLASFQKPWEPGRKFIRLRGRGRLRYWMAGPQVKALSREHDAVLAHFLPAYGVSAWRAEVPFALVLWGSDVLVWPFRDWFRFAIARRVLSSAVWVVADSVSVRRLLQLNFGYPPDRVSVFPFGPEENVLSFPAQQKDETLVIFPRAAERIYSPIKAIEALALLGKRGQSLRLVFTMAGSMTEDCRRVAESLGVNAEFNGPLPMREYLELMASAGLYLSLALSDATPVSLLEAMVLGAFPIVSDLPATREWIVDGLNGLLVDPRSHSSVACAVERSIENRDLVEYARGLNKQLVHGRRPWTDNLPVFSEVLAELERIGKPKMLTGKRRAFWSYM